MFLLVEAFYTTCFSYSSSTYINGSFSFILQFGEVDIDGSLVASHSSVAEDIVMVNNGCLCCTVRGDLVKLLLELVKKKRDKFDHIVIETTGELFLHLGGRNNLEI